MLFGVGYWVRKNEFHVAAKIDDQDEAVVFAREINGHPRALVVCEVRALTAAGKLAKRPPVALA